MNTLNSINQGYINEPNIRSEETKIAPPKHTLSSTIIPHFQIFIHIHNIKQKNVNSLITILNKLKNNKKYLDKKLQKHTVLYNILNLIENLKADDKLSIEELNDFILNLKNLNYPYPQPQPPPIKLKNKIKNEMYVPSNNIRTETSSENKILTFNFSPIIENIKNLYINNDLNPKGIKLFISSIKQILNPKKFTPLPPKLRELLTLIKNLLSEEKINNEEISLLIVELENILKIPQIPKITPKIKAGVVTLKNKL